MRKNQYYYIQEKMILRCFKILLTLAILVFVLYLAHGVILEKVGRFLYYKDELKPADVIVILAGEETERVEYGVKLFKEGWARKDKIIMAGGPVVWKYTWAALMQEHAIYLGAPKNAILLADRSRTTVQDAINTKALMSNYGYKSCILVTSPYHSKRATKIFKEVMGDKIQIISAPSASWFKFDDWWKRRRDRARVLDEYSKFLWLLMFGLKDNMAK